MFDRVGPTSKKKTGGLEKRQPTKAIKTYAVPYAIKVRAIKFRHQLGTKMYLFKRIRFIAER